MAKQAVGDADVPPGMPSYQNDLPPDKRPHPFSKVDHTFGTLDTVMAWLGGAAIANDPLAAQPLRI